MKKKKHFLVIGVVILAIIVFWVFYSSEGNNCLTIPVTEMNIGGHTNLAMHIHPSLKISLIGEEQVIPANIGLESGIMRAIHTHGGDGVLHIEAPCLRQFHLHEFFEVWGRPFSYDCIYDFCMNESHILEYSVNGAKTEINADFIMLDKDNIEIVYRVK